MRQDELKIKELEEQNKKLKEQPQVKESAGERVVIKEVQVEKPIDSKTKEFYLSQNVEIEKLIEQVMKGEKAPA